VSFLAGFRKALLAATLLASWGCDEGAPNEAKRMPKPPPPEDAGVAVAIAVSIDGKPAASIDTAKLDGIKPDFQDEERRAWRFSSLLGARMEASATVVKVTGEKGIVLELPRAASSTSPEPVLMVSRRGEVMAAMIEPENPFPQYHGRGGRLGRRGDPLPRIAGVTAVDVVDKP
jgi:hypothetical protein